METPHVDNTLATANTLEVNSRTARVDGLFFGFWEWQQFHFLVGMIIIATRYRKINLEVTISLVQSPY